MYLACETKDGKLFKVNVKRDFIKKQFKEKGFKSGETSLTFDDALINDESAEITSPVPPRLGKKNKKTGRRRLAIVEGDVSVLIIRVQAANAATTFSENQLSESVFGPSDPVTLRSQYVACSHAKLRIRPATSRVGRTSRIVNGATTITVDTFTSQGDAVMRNAITQKLNEEFGVSSPRALANHVHEIGHNLNLAHSNERGIEYDDRSGLMGFSYPFSDAPQMCFNSAKSWQLQWYRSRHLKLDSISRTAYRGELASILEDPDQISATPMLIKINNGNTDYFINFNRAAGFNSGTQEGADQVLITRSGIDIGSRFGSASLIICFEGSCGGGVTLPTPTLAPTPSPTPLPTISPSLTPTLGCEDGFIPILIEINTDNFPQETSFSLVNTCDASVVRTERDFTTRGVKETFRDCVPLGTYSFTIQDSYGDGLCCQYGNGSYSVSYGGEIVASGGTFTSSETKTFGDDCPLLASPSVSPTLSVSASPTSTQKPTVCVDDDTFSIALDLDVVLGPQLYTCAQVNIDPLLFCIRLGIEDRDKCCACRNVDIVATQSPTSLQTSTPSKRESSQPSSRPSREPSTSPEAKQSSSPTFLISQSPSVKPSTEFSNMPSISRSDQPSSRPTLKSSSVPTDASSFEPSISRSDQPSSRPTLKSSSVPTDASSFEPSISRSDQPSSRPTLKSSSVPTDASSSEPSISRSDQPSALSLYPTIGSSNSPIEVLSSRPTNSPSSLTSNSPSIHPSNSLPSIIGSNIPSIGGMFDVESHSPSRIQSPAPKSESPSSLPSSVPTTNIVKTSTPSFGSEEQCFDDDQFLIIVTLDITKGPEVVTCVEVNLNPLYFCVEISVKFGPSLQNSIHDACCICNDYSSYYAPATDFPTRSPTFTPTNSKEPTCPICISTGEPCCGECRLHSLLGKGQCISKKDSLLNKLKRKERRFKKKMNKVKDRKGQLQENVNIFGDVKELNEVTRKEKRLRTKIKRVRRKRKKLEENMGTTKFGIFRK
ncbi:hypothetical protein CTEN210_03484 [Chaetoceros tenuissimus]|uniref:Circumsporozoite protein n=1 Tax=Chaetoceros tenuissimus TaxID=426638 RepID=A0AAD3CLL2_9STRA|nr:hypothetical protein CTEN210_03484 [Chaetoceros tenuissimus]